MKVCLLNDSFPPLIDGVANTVKNYADILTRVYGDDVVVATPGYPGADYTDYPYRVIPYQSFNTAVLTAGYRLGNSYSPAALFKLTGFKPDIIHSHCPFSSLLTAKHVRALTGAPLIFTYHTKFDIEISRAVRYRKIQNAVVKGMISFISIADEVWTVSEGAGQGLKQLGYRGSCRVMPNGVDFPKGMADEAMVRKVTGPYDLPSDLPLYLFVGRIFNYKGLPIILDALKIIRDQGKDFRMVFIGDGADRKKVQNRIDEYGLSDKVMMIGKISDREELRAWYTRGDLFLFPSTYDTNGIVVREAAACGIASVLIRDSCAAEGISDRINGYLIEENAQAMAELLLRIGDDFKDMRAVGHNAMEQIYLSWEDAVGIARENYLRILSERR